MKKRVGIYEAKATFSQMLKAVRERGASFEITDRGQPVAVLSPLNREETFADRMSSLIIDGTIIPANNPEKNIELVVKKAGALKRFLESRD